MWVLSMAPVTQGLARCRALPQGVRVGTTGSEVTLEVATAARVNVEGGCALPDPCDSGPCPPHSYCSDDWDSFSCSCHPGECQQDRCVPTVLSSPGLSPLPWRCRPTAPDLTPLQRTGCLGDATA